MQNKDRVKVYEIGYLLASVIPEDKVVAETESIKKILSDAGATMVAEGNPTRQPLAYTIRRKTVAGSFDKFDQAYFGWLKFELDSSQIESVKKSVENIPSVIRLLVIITVLENTYLGKHGSAMVREQAEEGVKKESVEVKATVETKQATVEEIDKTIDAMVKEA